MHFTIISVERDWNIGSEYYIWIKHDQCKWIENLNIQKSGYGLQEESWFAFHDCSQCGYG